MEVKKACEVCGKLMTVKRSDKRFCSYTCRNKKRNKQPKEPPLPKLKDVQSVSEILKIGRAHGIYSYGKIVQAIERGEIE